MDKYTSDKYSLLGHSLRQCGFNSLEDYDKFKEETIAEMELSMPTARCAPAQNKKNIFQKLWMWITSI
jgi:hypothetical protein